VAGVFPAIAVGERHDPGDAAVLERLAIHSLLRIFTFYSLRGLLAH